MLLSIASLTCGSQNQKPPRSHIGCELGQFGAGKLAEPGQLDPEGALMFSVLPETGIWIDIVPPVRRQAALLMVLLAEG